MFISLLTQRNEPKKGNPGQGLQYARAAIPTLSFRLRPGIKCFAFIKLQKTLASYINSVPVPVWMTRPDRLIRTVIPNDPGYSGEEGPPSFWLRACKLLLPALSSNPINILFQKWKRNDKAGDVL